MVKGRLGDHYPLVTHSPLAGVALLGDPLTPDLLYSAANLPSKAAGVVWRQGNALSSFLSGTNSFTRIFSWGTVL